MSELTKIITVEITMIGKVNEGEIAELTERDNDYKAFEDYLKEHLSADDIKVSKVQNFVIDKGSSFPEKEITVSEIIEGVKEVICDRLCRYRDTTDEVYVCDYIREHKTCPLDRL